MDKTDEKPGEVEVIFVDCGTLDAVKRSNIRLNIILEQKPLQGIWCTLHNIQPPLGKSEWFVPILNSLQKRPLIEVTLTQRSKLNSIANFMVKNDMALNIFPKRKKIRSRNMLDQSERTLNFI